MSIGRGRVLRPDALRGGAATYIPLPPIDSAARPRRVPAVIVDAHAQAQTILADATREAAAHIEQARADAASVAETAAREARQAETARLAAGFVALREAEARRDAAGLARTMDLAKLLAERVIGAELRQDAAVIASAARRALEEARGARRVRIEACPADAEELARHTEALGLTSVEVTTREDLGRGDLILHTDLGALDARLTPQLDRFAAALRDALADAEATKDPA